MIKNFHDNNLPNGPNKGGMTSGLLNQYDVACQGTSGIVMWDVTLGGELIVDYDF